MKGLVYRGTHQVAWEERPSPAPGPGEVLVAVEACGVCGTDLHIYRGEAPAMPGAILGHEFGGRVVEVGMGVEGLESGQRVAVNPNLNCRVCRFCRTGQPHLCRGLKAYGVDLDGGFASHVKVAAQQVYPVPEALPNGAVALVEPLSCALHGLDLVDPRAGSSVLLVGAGPMGLLLLTLIRQQGAARIVVVDPREERRQMAGLAGADEVLDVADLRLVEEYDVVVEAAGSPAALDLALRAAAPGGTVLLFGVSPRGARLSVEPFDLYRRELRLQGAFTNPFTTGRAVALLAGSRLDLNPFLAGPLEPRDLPGFLASPPKDVLKGVLFFP